MPALRTAPAKKPFTKSIVTKGYGFHTPQDGSVCKIKIINDPNDIINDLDASLEKEFIVGDVDDPVDRIIEDCIRTMKEEEVCCLTFEQPGTIVDDCVIETQDCREVVEDCKEVVVSEEKGDDETAAPEKNSEESEAETVAADTEEPKPDESSKPEDTEATDKPEEPIETPEPVEDAPSNVTEVQFQLLSYTREPEIWEMSVTEKWRRACYHKQRGLELYSRGSYQYAFRRFGLTLKYVISLEHDVPAGQEDGMDIKGLKLSCYLNVAACQMRHHNFESVVMNSSKALLLQPNNAKALYRRGSAHLQLQEFEKAKEDLSMAQQLEPKNQAVAKQLQLLKSQVQKLNQYYATAMKKLFT